MKSSNTVRLAITSASVLLWAFLLIWTDIVIMLPSWPDHLRVVVWPDVRRSVAFLVLTVLLPLLGFVMSQWNRQPGKAGNLAWSAWVLNPLVFLPLSLTPLFFWPYLPDTLPSNLVFYIPVFLFSIVLYRFVSLIDTNKQNRLTFSFLLLIFSCFSLFYWLGGMYFAHWATDFNGDTGHYIIQAESLYFDHDLDLANNFDEREKRMMARQGSDIMHLSKNARNGNSYSWHSFGLPVLLAPFVPLGSPGLHLGLGLIAGLGSTGIVAACILIGTNSVIAFLLSLLFTLSSFWSFHAFQVMPETAGATAMIWMLISIVLIKSRPWLSLGIIVICCFLLPWIQTRFIPPAAVGALVYLLMVMRDGASRKNRTWRIALFLFISALGGMLYLYINMMMFEHARSYHQDFLFSYFPGMARALFSYRSTSSILPLFPVMAAATIWVVFMDRGYRLLAISVLAIFLSVLSTSCSNSGWTGGSVMAGRYLLVVTPLLLPFTVCLYQSGGVMIRWLILFLGVAGCVTFFVQLGFMYEIRGHFTNPLFILPFYRPLLDGLSNFFRSPNDIFGIFLQISMLFFVFFPSAVIGLRVLIVVIMLAGAMWSHQAWFKSAEGPYRADVLNSFLKHRNSEMLRKINPQRAHILLASDSGPKYGLADVMSNLLANYSSETISGITTRSLPSTVQGNLLSQPNLPVNDWQGRGYRWGTLVGPFNNNAGGRLMCMQGIKTGLGDVQFTVVELDENSSHTALEADLNFDESGLFSGCFSFELQGVGEVHLVSRFSQGSGIFVPKSLSWFSVNSNFVQRAHLALPFSLQ